MATRALFTSASTPPVTGPQLVDNLAGHLNVLLNASALIPTSVSNSGNDYTIVVDPELNADVANNMMFWVTPGADNTGNVRLRVTDGNPYYAWVKSDGSNFAEGELEAGVTYGVLFIDGEFRTVTLQAQEAGAILNRQVFTASGTWNKPDGLADNAIVFVELWGAGGGGSRRAGGGGGAYVYKIFRGADLGLTESVTIGSGGTGGEFGGAGGNSSFGAHFTAYGGGGGGGSGSGNRVGGGGGGGGSQSAGSNASGTSGGNGGRGGGGGTNGLQGSVANTVGTGFYGAGGGCSGADATNSVGGRGGDALYGGGGGGGSALSSGSDGGDGGMSTFGGGGGGAGGDDISGVGGTSVFGGNGGNAGLSPQAGSAPGGGGGGNRQATGSGSGAAGARGECRVLVIG